MSDPAAPRAQIRPFAGREEYERMIDYFVNADHAFLRGMGVDPQKMPSREAWLASAMADHDRPDAEKERAYLAWIYDGEAVGHSSIGKIRFGEDAFIHLHLWVADLRKAGLGTQYFRASAEHFMRTFELQRLSCEPYAENPGPNRVLPEAGFRLVEKYRTVPGAINFEQAVNRWVWEGQNPPA